MLRVVIKISDETVVASKSCQMVDEHAPELTRGYCFGESE